MMKPLFIALVAIPTIACAAPWSPRSQSDGARLAALERKLAGPDGTVMVVAHRGCWLDTAENSLAAIDACVAMGADMVELDVRKTRDGALVLMHDVTVDRTTSGTGKVADLTLAEIRQLRLRPAQGGTDRVPGDWRIPTLGEALSHAAGRILVNIDAKEEVRDAAALEVSRLGLSRQVLFKTETSADAIARRPWVKSAAFQPIVNERKHRGDVRQRIASYARYRPVGVEVVFDNLSYLDAVAEALRGQPVRVWANTLDYDFSGGYVDRIALQEPDRVWGMMIDRGVDAIQTDQPRALLAYLQRASKSPGPAPSGHGAALSGGQEQ